MLFKDFLAQYGTTILYSVLVAFAGIFGKWIGSMYKNYINDKTKEAVVRVCVKAVEQLYTDLHGEDKYNKAVEAIVEMLTIKGITITELEIKMLIESTCQEFTKTVKETITPVEVIPDA